MENQITERDVEDFLMANESFFKNLLTRHHKKCEFLKVVENTYYGSPSYELLVSNRDVIIIADFKQFKILKEECTITYQETSYNKIEIADCSLSWITFLVKQKPDFKDIIMAELEKDKQKILIHAQEIVKPHEEAIKKVQEKVNKKLGDIAQMEIAIQNVYINSKSSEQ